MALPIIKVIREAETEPELPVMAVSIASKRTFSMGTASASAAICRMTVRVPWPTSALAA